MNLVAPKSKVDANSSGGVCAPNSALSSSHLIAICQNGTRYPATVTPARLSDLDFAADLVRDATGLAVSARLHLPRNAIVQKSDGSVVTAAVRGRYFALSSLTRRSDAASCSASSVSDVEDIALPRRTGKLISGGPWTQLFRWILSAV